MNSLAHDAKILLETYDKVINITESVYDLDSICKDNNLEEEHGDACRALEDIAYVLLKIAHATEKLALQEWKGQG